jgi:hypothetical protein
VALRGSSARRFAVAGVALLLSLPGALPAGGAGAATDSELEASAILRRQLGQLAAGGLSLQGTDIASRAALPLLYQGNGDRLFWTPGKLTALLAVARDSVEDGLTPV